MHLPSFSSAARYFGLVPKCVTRSRSAIRQSTSRSGANGEPSYSTSAQPRARPETSQFHIIQPQVVK